MKQSIVLFFLIFNLGLKAQQNVDMFKMDKSFLNRNFPEGTIYTPDVVYKTVDSLELKLDILRPGNVHGETPVLISIHGGAWLSGTRTQDFFYGSKLFSKLLAKGYAIVSIDYRLSQQAKFPAQIQDCNDAINFIYQNSEKYNLNKDKISVTGGSAGGHLAALVGTSNEHNITEFYMNGIKPKYKIKAVIDCFGVSDLIACRGNSGMVDHDDSNSAEAQLLGFPPLIRPDLAKLASPTTYITKNTPPFLIYHGDKDPIVQYSQSILLHSYLDLAGVKNKFITVKGAGHGGPEFGKDEYDNETILFLDSYMMKSKIE
jgi:acetyl esterase/lipase